MMTVIKSLWVTPTTEEKEAPKKRIIHAKTVRFSGIGKNIRIGFCQGEGYYKCGSDRNIDAVADADIYIEKQGKFELYESVRGINPGKECIWYSVPMKTTAVCIAVRRSKVDEWWPCYNITRGGIVVEAEEEVLPVSQRNLLKVTHIDIESNEDVCGVTKEENSIVASWKTPFYKIGLRKKSAGLYSFSCDGTGEGNTHTELAKRATMMFDDNGDYIAQGPLLYPLGMGDCCNLYSIPLLGSTEISDNSLCYNLRHEESGLSWKMSFTMLTDRIKIKVEGDAERESHWAIFSLLRLSFESKATPPTLLAAPERNGETGLVTFKSGNKAILHFPRFGSIMCTGNNLGLRMTSVRDTNANVLDLVLPDLDLPNGSSRLPGGHFEGELELSFKVPLPRKVRDDAPEVIRRAVEMFELTALPFRMDTSTFSNNGNSMGAPICMDVWTDICAAIGDGGFPKVSPMLRNTLELWLLGAPAYASGRSSDRTHFYEEEYIMTYSAAFVGMGGWLTSYADKEWFCEYRDIMVEKLQQALRRADENDGIIVSPYRRGVSGEAQWSTAWYDVISYGWKDALSNVILYRGLLLLEKGFERFGDLEIATVCKEWSAKIKQHYWDTFRTENGWVAGWRCANDEIHDYGFLAVNGMAAKYGLIPENEAKNAIEKLWNALLDAGFDSFEAGLPGNVYCIPKKDLAGPQQLYPFGGYQNAGVTLSQSCHFMRGMLSVGMEEQVRFVLEKIAEGLCSGICVGGVGSGVDWQTWDGVASGYEGYLCDQMGVMALMLEIWGE